MKKSAPKPGMNHNLLSPEMWKDLRCWKV